MIKNAIELKSAIEKVVSTFTPIGRNISDIINWREDHDKPVSKKWKIYKEIDDVIKEFWVKFERCKNFESATEETVKDAHLEIACGDALNIGKKCLKDFTPEDFQAMYDNAAPAGYGNVKELKTEYDPKVRVARELPTEQFKVDDHLVQRMQDLWQSSNGLLPSEVTIVPYKINLYGPGSFFTWHKDTPDKDMYGTIICGLYDSSDEGAKGNHPFF